MTFFLERFVFRKQRTAEPFQRLVVVPQLVGRRAGIELDPVRRVRVWVFFQSSLELLIGFAVIIDPVGVEARGGGEATAGAKQEHRRGCKRPSRLDSQ